MSESLDPPIRCVILRNTEKPQEELELLISPKLTRKEFLDFVGSKLHIRARRAFFPNGEEVVNLSLLADEERIYVTEGEELKKEIIAQFIEEEQSESGNRGESEYNPLAQEDRNKINIAISGPAGVGKSSVVLQYVYKTFYGDYVPTIEDQYKKIEPFEGEQVEVNILDTSGTDEFIPLRHAWMANKDAIILCYSIEKENFLKEVEKFFQEISFANQFKTVPIALVANKIDIKKRMITREQGQEVANKNGALFFECSAKENQGIVAIFHELISKVKSERLKKENELKLLQLQQQSQARGANTNGKKQGGPNVCGLECKIF